MHNPRIGRFFSVDPLSPKYPHYTPYSFSGNKVIAFVELEGLEEAKPKEGRNMPFPLLGTPDPTRIPIHNPTKPPLRIPSKPVGSTLNKGGRGLISIFTYFGPKVFAPIAFGVMVLSPVEAGTRDVFLNLQGEGSLTFDEEHDLQDLRNKANSHEQLLPHEQQRLIELEDKLNPHALHGNSKTNQRPQHGYVIIDLSSGEILEYGVSGQKRSEKDKMNFNSPRIRQKLRTKYNNNPNVIGYVIKEANNRQEILDWELKKVQEYYDLNGEAPDEQKRPKPE